MTKIDKSKLPSRYVTNSHGCEARKTMMYNIKTELYPDGLSEEDLQKPITEFLVLGMKLHLVILLCKDKLSLQKGV